ncbi:MAG: class A beta-lactamase-related serine hydrolase, partial [Candidatus Eremiobacteraeota bacterium]|nr:class A beta-lactamase-related serine hydrolase [Candidatus Eremiobacteraeota bacterium]
IVIRRFDESTDPQIAIEPDRYLYPASMLKTPLALAAMTLIEEGVFDFDCTFEVAQTNMTANDKPSPLVPGYTAKMTELIELMLTISDNVATNLFFDILGRERATAIVQDRYGLAHTAFYRKLSGSEPLIHDPQWDGKHRNMHSCGDAARVFELIAKGQIPRAQYLREVLSRQQFNNKLSEGLRSGDSFAHKTGDTDEVTHDGGILTTKAGPSYIVVVYTGLESSDANNARFAPFMREIRALL